MSKNTSSIAQHNTNGWSTAKVLVLFHIWCLMNLHMSTTQYKCLYCSIFNIQLIIQNILYFSPFASHKDWIKNSKTTIVQNILFRWPAKESQWWLVTSQVTVVKWHWWVSQRRSMVASDKPAMVVGWHQWLTDGGYWRMVPCWRWLPVIN